MKMSRIYTIISLLFIAVSGIGAQDRMQIDDFNVAPGKSRQINVALTNSASYTGFQADIELPNNLTLSTTDGEAEISLTSRADDTHMLVTNQLSEKLWRVVCFSIENIPFNGTEGELMNIKISTTQQFAGGEIVLKNIIFTNEQNQDVVFENTTATVGVHEQNTLSVSPLQITQEGEYEVTISLNNDTEFTAFQTEIILPSELTIIDGSFKLTDRATTSHKLSTQLFGNNKARVVVNSMSNTSINNCKGAIVTFKVEPQSGVSKEGEIILQNNYFSDALANEYKLPNTSATVTISTSVKYTVSVSATQGGTAEASATEVEEGATVTLTATPNPGYAFVNWTVNGEVVSTENPYTATITANTEFVANFEVLPTSGKFEAVNSDGVTIWYNITSYNTAEVTYKGSSSSEYSGEYSGEVNIPSTVEYSGNTYSVTTIGDDAFYNCNGLTSVTIPNSVTAIGEDAFLACTGLTSVVIPEGVTSIGRYAFYYCGGLTSVVIPEGVTTIGDHAFYDCVGLTNVTIPESVTSIGSSAFYNCTGLTEIEVAEGNINYSSEDGVLFNKDKTKLIQYPKGNSRTSYSIPEGVTTIGESAFMGSKGLTSVVIPEGVTTIGDYAFSYCRRLTSVVIPNSVTTIGASAFRDCDGLTSVTIPNSVTTIGEDAFSYCDGLTSVVISEGVTTIGEDAFLNCTGLTEIEVAEGNINYSSEDGVLFNKDKTELIQYSIGNSRTSYSIPEGVTTIGESAFSGCKGLTSVTIPNSVTTIGASAFEDCYGLTSVTIPNSVTTIGESAFEDCVGLTNVTIPESVTSIGKYAFYNCTGLTEIYSLNPTAPDITSTTFGKVSKTIPVYIPKGSLSSYQSAEYWSEFTNFVEIKEIYTISVSSSDESMGSATASETEVEEGATVTLTATPNDGYKFTNWTLGGEVVSTENPYQATITANTEFVANFEIDPYNVHEYVDLGLSVKWATCNVGATSPEGYGNYFAWGETKPKDNYSWDSYKYCNGSYNTLTKYCVNSHFGTVDNKTKLELEDDAAYVNWGGNWRMPTEAEQDELRNTNNCTWEWTTQNGVNGYKVTSNVNGNFIFLPAAGYRDYENLKGAGSIGLYWSSSHGTSNSNGAYYVYFNSSTVDLDGGNRYCGQPVRAVYDSSTPAPTPIVCTVTVSATEGGEAEASATEVENGEEVTLTATPAPGYAFVNWTVNGEEVSTENPYTATVTADTEFVANFEEFIPEYVDLGLPSGIKWATCNVGATSPEGYGNYFAWGETKPKTSYNWSTYKYCNGSDTTMTKYCTSSDYGTIDNKTELELEDDAAHVNWGGNWRMPTLAELSELKNTNNCTWTWTTQNGVNGCKVTSKVNGNSIFLPAAGIRDDDDLDDAGSGGYYWSSSLQTVVSYRAIEVSFDSSSDFLSSVYRCRGRSVRAVCESSTPAPTPIVCTVSVSSADETMGTAEASATEVEEGATVTLTATPNDGYEFVNWTVNGEVVSTTNPYTATVTANTEFVANFEEKPNKITITSIECSEVAWASFVIENAIDNDYSTNYESNNYPSNGTTVTVSFDTNKVLDKVVVYFSSQSVPSQGKFQISDDGSSWTDIEGSTFTSSQKDSNNAITVDCKKVAAKYLRLNIVKVGASYLKIFEFEVYGKDMSVDARTISVSVNDETMGTVYIGEEGVTEVADSTDPLQLVAVANEGYEFVNWTINGEIVGTDATIYDTTEGDKAYVANFVALDTYNVSVSVNDAMMGTASVSKTGEVFKYAEVTFTATPGEGYEFVNWTVNGEEVSKVNPLTISVEQDAEYVANFRMVLSKLPLEAAEATMEHYYVYTADKMIDGNLGSYYDTQYTQTHYAEDLSVTVTLAEESSIGEVKIYFASNYRPDAAKIQVSTDGNEWTDVEGGEFASGDAIVVGGKMLNVVACNGEIAKYVRMLITTKANQYLTIYEFEVYEAPVNVAPRTISVSVNDDTMGSAYVGVEGTTELTEQTGAVKLVATPSSNAYRFVNWTVDGVEVSTSATFVDRTEGDKAYVANFEAKPIYTVSVSSATSKRGSASCDAAEVVYEGDVVTFTATPTDGYGFINWTVNGEEVSTENPYALEITESVALVANFDVNPELDRSEWSVYTVSSQYAGMDGADYVTGEKAIDGKFSTYWHSDWDNAANKTVPQWIVFDLGAVKSFDSFNYVSRAENQNQNGNIGGYKLYVSTEAPDVNDLTGTMEAINEGTFTYPAQEHKVELGKAYSGQYVMLYATSTYGSGGANMFANCAEFYLYLSSYSVTVTPSNPAHGTVYIETEGTTSYPCSVEGTDVVTITAVAAEKYQFVNWTLNGEVVSTDAVYTTDLVTEVRAYVANFEFAPVAPRTVTAAVNNSSKGSVLFLAPESTEASVVSDSIVVMEAVPATADDFFVNWTINGEEVGTEETYEYLETEDVTIQANFISKYIVTVEQADGGTITVKADGTSIFTGDRALEGSNLTISVVENSRSELKKLFVNGTDVFVQYKYNPNFAVAVTGPMTITAEFGDPKCIVTWENIGNGYVEAWEYDTYDEEADADGTLELPLSPVGVQYAWGDEVPFLSTLAIFAYPMGDDVLESITINGEELDLEEDFFTYGDYFIPEVESALHIVATFSGVGTGIYKVSVVSADEEMGSAEASATEVENGDEVTLTATPAPGYAFVNWTVNGEVVSTENPYTATVTANTEFVANFEEFIPEYVDLGLPSGIKWATCNVGATSPEGYGNYFAWGETKPKTAYDWSTYKYCNGSNTTMTKYCTDSSYGTIDNKTVLELDDDVARVIWGGNWRMPTRAEEDELRDTNNCTWTWTTQNGVNGYKVTSNVNGNFIFLPAAGYRYYDSIYDAGTYGFYWSSSLFKSNSYSACYLDFGSVTMDWAYNSRFYGLSVRAVSAPLYLVSVSATEGGEAEASSTEVEGGAVVTLTATPAPGYNFVNWTVNGEVVSSENPYIATVTATTEYVANFEEGEKSELNVNKTNSSSEATVVVKTDAPATIKVGDDTYTATEENNLTVIITIGTTQSQDVKIETIGGQITSVDCIDNTNVEKLPASVTEVTLRNVEASEVVLDAPSLEKITIVSDALEKVAKVSTKSNLSQGVQVVVEKEINTPKPRPGMGTPTIFNFLSMPFDFNTDSIKYWDLDSCKWMPAVLESNIRILMYKSNLRANKDYKNTWETLKSAREIHANQGFVVVGSNKYGDKVNYKMILKFTSSPKAYDGSVTSVTANRYRKSSGDTYVGDKDWNFNGVPFLTSGKYPDDYTLYTYDNINLGWVEHIPALGLPTLQPYSSVMYQAQIEGMDMTKDIAIASSSVLNEVKATDDVFARAYISIDDTNPAKIILSDESSENFVVNEDAWYMGSLNNTTAEAYFNIQGSEAKVTVQPAASELAMTVYTGVGTEHRITLTTIDGNYDVYLRDVATDKVVCLNDEDYTFTAAAKTTIANRFVVSMVELTGICDQAKADGTIKAVVAGDVIKLYGTEEGEQISLYTASGMVITNAVAEDGVTTIATSATGVVIIKVADEIVRVVK